MHRRRFLSTALSAVLSVTPSSAQNIRQVRRIGVLMGIKEAPYPLSVLAQFRARLRELGWIEESNLHIDVFWSDNSIDKARELAQAVLDLKPDLLVGHTDSSVIALLERTRSIPIVFVTVSDPIGLGFVKSLSHPGGSATGFVNFEPSLGGKWLDILKEIAPQVRRAVMIYNPKTAPRAAEVYSPSLLAAGKIREVVIEIIQIKEEEDIEKTLTSLGREPGSGLIVVPDNFVTDRTPLIISLCARYNLPAIHPYPYFPTAGGLLSYGIDPVDTFRKAPDYIDRILRGARPEELSVQLPTKFQLIINLKTSKAFGLTVPATLMAIADRVIE